jgi:hypothetical protein
MVLVLRASQSVQLRRCGIKVMWTICLRSWRLIQTRRVRQPGPISSDAHIANIALEFNLDWVGELIRILKVQIDYTDIDQPHDNLIRNAVLQSCLSIMHSIGFRGRLKPQSFCGKLAMINLNVRNANLLITMAINPPPPLREKTNPLDEDGL